MDESNYETCFACGKKLAKGDQVSVNEASYMMPNIKVQLSVVCCSDECAADTNEILQLLTGMCFRAADTAMHLHGSVELFLSYLER